MKSEKKEFFEYNNINNRFDWFLKRTLRSNSSNFTVYDCNDHYLTEFNVSFHHLHEEYVFSTLNQNRKYIDKMRILVIFI